MPIDFQPLETQEAPKGAAAIDFQPLEASTETPDLAATIPGMTGFKNPPKLPKTAKDVGIGGLETLGNLASGLYAQIPAGVAALGKLAQGKFGEVEPEYERILQESTYQPRTELGQEYSGKAGELINQLIPMAPVLHTMPFKTPERVFQGNPRVAPEPPPLPTSRNVEAYKNISPETIELQKAFNRGIPEEAVKNEVDQTKQQELPFDTSPEAIAAKQAEGQPQGDMFVRDFEQQNALRDSFELNRQKELDFQNMDRAAGETPAIWKAADTDYPVEIVQGDINTAPDGRVYQKVLYQGKETYVPADELTTTTGKGKSGESTPTTSKEAAFKQAELEKSVDALLQKWSGKVPRNQRGSAPVINHLAALIEDTAKKGSEALRELHDKLYGQYADSGYKNQAYLDAAHAAVQKGVEVKKQEQYVENINNPSMGVIGPQGQTYIPSGTKVIATHGMKYKEPTRGTVVGEKQLTINGQPYRFPVVDFGDGQPRTLTPGDLKTVFSGPKNQRGSAPFINDLADLLIEKSNKINKILGEEHFTPTMPTASIIEQSLKEGRDGRGFNNMEAGATLTAAKRDSTLIREGSRVVQDAQKKAELASHEIVFPAEQAIKKLSRNEVTSLGDVFKQEMFGKELVDKEAQGWSEKQMKAYVAVRDMFDQTYARQMEARRAQGLESITKKEFYLSSRWNGDFRMPVLDKEGHIRWYLAADTKMGVNSQWKALSKEFPELVPGKMHTVKSSKNVSDVQGVMSTAIDVLGRDDPAVARLKEWAENQVVNEGKGAYAQEKHFEPKQNVRGFVGDRPGFNRTSDAIDMFQQQMTYARNGLKWSEMQKAGEQLKDVLTNPDLAEQQPNNVAYMKDYFRNQLGMGEARWVAALDDAIRDTGISPSVFSKAVGGTKTFFILQKLFASVGYTASNVIQYVNNLPHMVDISKNPLALAWAVPQGLATGLLMASGHYLKHATDSKILYKSLAGVPDGEFLVRAMKYAEDNGITSRSIVDESPVGNSFSLLGRAENIAGKTLSVPETLLRSASYMTYVQLLKSTGKFKDNLSLFREAEEAVNIAMADYRASERAMVFNKLGTVGNALNTLQTYPINYYQQFNYFAREAKKGNPLPFLAFMGTQYAVAGAMGVPGFNDASKLFDWLKSKLPTKLWMKVKDVDPKQWLLEHGGPGALYGELSNQTGVGFTSRVTAPSGGEMLASPAGPIKDIAKQVGSVASLATDPMNTDKQTQAIMDVAPTGLQGYLETGPLRDRMSVQRPDGTRVYRKTTDVEQRKGMVSRTPAEESIRALGLRSQKEVEAKDQAYRVNTATAEAQKRSINLIDDIYASARQGKPERTQELITLYAQLTGKELTKAQWDNQIMQEYTTAVERASTSAKTLEALKNVKRMRDFMEKRNENANQLQRP